MRAEPNGAELDLDAFKKRLQAAREFEFRFEGLEFGCVLPMPIDERIVALRNGETGVVGAELWKFELAIGAVRSWNACARELAPGDKYGDRALPCTPELVRLLFSARPEIADALGIEIVRRRQARNAKLEEDEKNSASASPGSDPGRKRSASAASSETPSPVPH